MFSIFTLLLLRREIEEGSLLSTSGIIVADDGISDRSIIADKPYVGQIFDSLDDVKSFYMYYGGKVGFFVCSFFTKHRMDKNTQQKKCSQQLLVCSREGFSKQGKVENQSHLHHK